MAKTNFPYEVLHINTRTYVGSCINKLGFSALQFGGKFAYTKQGRRRKEWAMDKPHIRFDLQEVQ